MDISVLFNNWLALLGGISGAAFLAYMVLMVYFNRRKEKEIQELRRDISEIKGILLGRKR